MRAVNQATIELVKQFEGCKLTAYRCPAGILTIGYGSTRDVHEGMDITHAEADIRLSLDLRDAGRAVTDAVAVALTDDQFGALTAFSFNVGAGAFRKSTLLKKLNAGNYAAVQGELLKWCRAGGHIMEGLRRRRLAEGALFNARTDS